MALRGAEWKCTSLNLGLSGRPRSGTPIQGPMKLRESHDPFEIAGFSVNSRRVVVQVDAQTGGTEDRTEIAEEPIYHTQSKQVASMLDRSIVVGREDVQPFSARGTACEGQKEPAEQPADTVRLLRVVSIGERLIDATFGIENLLEKGDEGVV